jgi:metallo-beta-lactamase class B
VAATIGVGAQARVPDTPESLVSAAKRAAGGDYSGTFLRICVAPDNLAAAGPRGAGPGPRVVPDRATWYAKPYKVFDNLYFVGTRIHSAWALTTSDGIIVIDTLFDYAIEPEIVDGLTALGLDPRSIKYVLISHAHGDHDQGAALLQSRYGPRSSWGRRTGSRRSSGRRPPRAACRSATSSSGPAA